jgi:hypothetical protein
LPTRRRTRAVRSRARDAAERAMLDEWQRTHPAGGPEVHVRRLLDAVEAAGVRLVAARPDWPSQPELDLAASGSLERLAQALACLHAELSIQEHAAAAGPGTLLSDVRARLSDPTPGRVTFGTPFAGAEGQVVVPGELRDPRGTVGARLGDPGEVRRLTGLHRDSLHRIDTEAALLTGEIWLEERPEWAATPRYVPRGGREPDTPRSVR